ncbi:serine/threonine kinase [Aureococcus anophagefferens]|nr:serine/threonine kinase [Aureococcus anophagefferens]
MNAEQDWGALLDRDGRPGDDADAAYDREYADGDGGSKSVVFKSGQGSTTGLSEFCSMTSLRLSEIGDGAGGDPDHVPAYGEGHEINDVNTGKALVCLKLDPNDFSRYDRAEFGLCREASLLLGLPARQHPTVPAQRLLPGYESPDIVRLLGSLKRERSEATFKEKLAASSLSVAQHDLWSYAITLLKLWEAFAGVSPATTRSNASGSRARARLDALPEAAVPAEVRKLLRTCLDGRRPPPAVIGNPATSARRCYRRGSGGRGPRSRAAATI